ncbi:MAG: SpoIIE family protein phosphatase [Acidobacteriota bacterium]|jgi:sigma-B regulation protein RsbU (phosphoserine phosphatase)|nr:SpoIIE family protein phosphatase [Acidobacteriota bacterium]
MPLSDLLRLADVALSGHAGPDLPEEILRVVVEETGSRAGVLKKNDEAIARWPRTVSAQVEEATEGWSEIPFGGDEGQWCLRLLHLDRLDESALDATRIGLRAWQLREELKRSRFDERFHLWELEAIRSIATGIGGILDTEILAEELISHLVALLGVRSAHLYFGDSPLSASIVGGFGTARLEQKDIEPAWHQGIYTDDLVAIPLKTGAGTLGILVASDKEARAGTEPFAANDVRLLELFAVQVTVAMEYARLTQESLERERLKRELEMAAVIQSHLHPKKFPDLEGYRLAVRSSSSRQVAGDTYDVLIRDNVLIATVTDVSGKGVGAGMIASGVHAGVRLMAGGSSDLSEVAGRINSYLSGATADNRFATFAMVSIDPEGGLRAVNAGHLPVLIRRRDGTIEEINSSGLPLGILEMASYSESVARIEPGELVALFTDGLTEAEDSNEEEFGVKRVAKVTTELAEPTAEKLCDAILEAVETFTDGATLHDDATLLVVERLQNDR